MKPYRVLDTAENQVINVEGVFLDVAIMVAVNAFQVSGRLDEGSTASFFKAVNVDPPDFFHGALIILLDCERLPHDIGR